MLKRLSKLNKLNKLSRQYNKTTCLFNKYLPDGEEPKYTKYDFSRNQTKHNRHQNVDDFSRENQTKHDKCQREYDFTESQVYIAGAVACFIITLGGFLHHIANTPSDQNIFFAICAFLLSIFSGILWPIVLGGVIVFYAGKLLANDPENKKRNN